MAQKVAIEALPASVQNFSSTPDEAIIRPKAASILLGYSPATFWREVRRGKIRVQKLSPRTTGTTAGEIRARLATKAV